MVSYWFLSTPIDIVSEDFTKFLGRSSKSRDPVHAKNFRSPIPQKIYIFSVHGKNIQNGISSFLLNLLLSRLTDLTVGECRTAPWSHYEVLFVFIRLFFTRMKYLTLLRDVIGPSPFHRSLYPTQISRWSCVSSWPSCPVAGSGRQALQTRSLP